MSIDVPDVVRLACYFSALIRAEASPIQLAEIRSRNASPEYAGACATHDLLDANCLMFGALSALLFEAPDLSDAATVELMGKAWDLARLKGFAD
jgi:hypothetical protein